MYPLIVAQFRKILTRECSASFAICCRYLSHYYWLIAIDRLCASSWSAPEWEWLPRVLLPKRTVWSLRPLPVQPQQRRLRNRFIEALIVLFFLALTIPISFTSLRFRMLYSSRSLLRGTLLFISVIVTGFRILFGMHSLPWASLWPERGAAYRLSSRDRGLKIRRQRRDGRRTAPRSAQHRGGDYIWCRTSGMAGTAKPFGSPVRALLKWTSDAQ